MAPTRATVSRDMSSVSQQKAPFRHAILRRVGGHERHEGRRDLDAAHANLQAINKIVTSSLGDHMMCSGCAVGKPSRRIPVGEGPSERFPRNLLMLQHFLVRADEAAGSGGVATEVSFV